MKNRRISISIVGIAWTALLLSQSSIAQPASGPVVSSKAEAKAERKTQRKEARARNKAEVGALKQNGYKPVGDDLNYPQNIQEAERKRAASSAGPASGTSK